jgi:HEAT repeat protein
MDSVVATLVLENLDGRSIDLVRLARRLWALCGTEAEGASLDELIAGARTGGWAERVRSAAELGCCNNESLLVGQELLALLDDVDADVRVTALLALDARGMATGAVLGTALVDSDWEVRLHATSIATSKGDRRRAHLLQALESSDSRVRVIAMCAIREADCTNAALVASVSSALSGQDLSVRLAALHACARLDEARLLSPGFLSASSQDRDARIRCAVMRSIRWWKDDAMRAQILSRGVVDTAGVRLAAWRSISANPAAIHASYLLKGLKESDARVRTMALEAISTRLASDTLQLRVGAIQAALSDDHLEVRLAAIQAVSLLPEGPGPCIGTLVAMLATPSLRSVAATALGRESAEAPDAIRPLCRLICEHKCRATAASALGRIGSAARLAIPLLRTLLRSEHPLTRIAAATALRRLGESCTSILDAVFPLLEDPNFVYRCKALEALEAIVRPGMSAAVESTTGGRGLRRIWPMRPHLRKRVVERVKRCLADSELEVRAQAVRTLEAIGSK